MSSDQQPQLVNQGTEGDLETGLFKLEDGLSYWATSTGSLCKAILWVRPQNLALTTPEAAAGEEVEVAVVELDHTADCECVERLRGKKSITTDPLLDQALKLRYDGKCDQETALRVLLKYLLGLGHHVPEDLKLRD